MIVNEKDKEKLQSLGEEVLTRVKKLHPEGSALHKRIWSRFVKLPIMRHRLDNNIKNVKREDLELELDFLDKDIQDVGFKITDSDHKEIVERVYEIRALILPTKEDENG